VKSTVYIKKYS